MKQVYRINVISAHKPWRYSHTILITDGLFFDKIKSYVAEYDTWIPDIPAMSQVDVLDEDDPEYDEDANFIDEIWEACQEDISIPYVLVDELTLYDE